MTSNKELETGLRAIAEDFHLPGGGRKKLSRLVAGHLAWFDAAERRGMGWRDMIRVLTAVGITGRGGKPLSIGTLSSTVWRKRSEAVQEANRRPKNLKPRRQVGSRKVSPGESTNDSAGQFRGNMRATAHFQPPQAAPILAKRLNSGGGAQSNKDVLAFMDRARSVRRRSE